MSADSARSSEAGDTLVEVLLSLVILGIAAMALVTGFAVAITSSANHRSLTTLDASVRGATDAAIAQVQQNQALAFGTCPNTYTSTTFLQNQHPLGNSFTITGATVQYWSTTTQAFSSNLTTNPCTNYGPQQWTLTVSNGKYTTTTSTVIYDPAVPLNTNPIGQAAKLVWLQSPTTGVVNSPLSPQPEIAVEDASGDIISNDFSSVTLTISGPGSLSSTCSGVESYGVVPFGDCSVNVAGGPYQLSASDSNIGSPPTAFPAPNTFSVSPAPAAKLVFKTSALTAYASSNATLGPITVQEEDAFGNLTTGGISVTLTSTGGGVFAASSGGTTSSTLTLNIPTGSNSTSFYFADTVSGSPMITASSNGLAPATQVEIINPGAPSKLAFTSSPFTIAQGSSASTPFTVSLEDQYNNVTTTQWNGSNGSTTTVNLTSSSSNPKFAKTLNGTTSATLQVTIAAAASSVTAYYGDPNAGSPTLTAAASGLTSGTQVETIALAPAKLVFTTIPVSGNASSSANLGPITVQEQSSGGIPTIVPETVNLSSTSGNGIFSLTPGGTPVTSVSIPAGSSNATFYYGDTAPGHPTLTAAATGLTSGTQPATINVGPLSASSSPPRRRLRGALSPRPSPRPMPWATP